MQLSFGRKAQTFIIDAGNYARHKRAMTKTYNENREKAHSLTHTLTQHRTQICEGTPKMSKFWNYLP